MQISNAILLCDTGDLAYCVVMRHRFLLLLFAGILMPGLIFASRANQPGHFGLGGILGEPTGVSGKYVATDLIAVQGALGLSIIERGLWLSGDVLLQFRNVFTQDGKWPLYLGGGLVIQDRGYNGKNNSGSASLGLRGVVGVEFLPQDRISIFGEASIQPFIIPSISLGVSLAVGARYWF